MRIMTIGAGAVGGYFAGRLAEAGADIESGGPVEADHILGFMLAKARRHGFDDTLHAIACIHAKAYEERRAAGRL